MVLVDTSVWIRSLANRQPFVTGLQKLLDEEEVAGHEFIYGELLVGGRGRRQFLAAYEQILQASVVPHGEVIAFVQRRGLNGRGVGWIDIHLLASAIVGGLRLWTADSRLAALCREFGVAYEAPA